MRVPLLLCLTLTACGIGVRVDGGVESEDGGEQIDAGLDTDAGADDGGVIDSGVIDSGVIDSGVIDSGVIDSGVIDSGVIDSGVIDSGVVDAGVNDAGAVDAGVADAGPACSRCAAYRSPVNAGVVATSALTEISGLAASRIHPNVLYAHNDSGGLPVVYAISSSGSTLGELQLAGATALDWEDMAVGPCPTGSCIYLADIGDNGSNRSTPYYVYRVTEPVAPPSGPVTVSWERFELQYPASLKTDAETLMVHPLTGDLYVVSKRMFGSKSAAYKATAPLNSAAPNVMTKIADLAVPDGLDLPITGGDIDPCGSAFLLRSYSVVYQFAGSGPFDGLFTAAFTRVPTPPLSLSADGELTGEAVGWAPGGGYFTVSEGMSQTLHRVACQ